METKTCSSCKEVKPESEFYIVNQKIRSRCKLCENELSRISYWKQKQKRQRKIEVVENLPNEIWIPIPNYEGLYEVSNMGRVKSCKKSFFGKLVNKNIELPEKIMKQGFTKSGYKQITLCKDAVKYTITTHLLVFF